MKIYTLSMRGRRAPSDEAFAGRFGVDAGLCRLPAQLSTTAYGNLHVGRDKKRTLPTCALRSGSVGMSRRHDPYTLTNEDITQRQPDGDTAPVGQQADARHS